MSSIMYDPSYFKKWAEFGVLAVEMETAALYTLASKYKAKALSILTISDSLVSPEITSSEEREKNIQWNDWACTWNCNKIKKVKNNLLLSRF